MSQTTSRRSLPVSLVNLILAAVLLAAGVAQALAENWWLAFVFAAVAVVCLASALYARRADSRDITRVNALEYRDERDRVIAREGFSIVGASALILTGAEILGSSIFGPEYTWLFALQLIALCVVWAIANQVSVARR